VEVARLIAYDCTKSIGAQLVVTEATVELHVANVMARVDLHTRAQIAAWMVERVRPGM
jgi:DNA-binding NarL/FixJ family response regulator